MPKKSPQTTSETTFNTEEMPPMREERTVYAELLPSQSDAQQFDPDQEASFQDWADALGTERSGYILRAYRLPMDEKGRAVSSGGNSIFLEAWPLDAVKYDDLLRILRDEYMLPGMQTMAVRLMVSKDGERGVKKNQVIYVQKSLRGAAHSNEHKTESVTELLRAIQENSQAQMNQLRDLMRNNAPPQVAQRDPFEMMTMMLTAMGPIISAIAGKPASPGGSMKEMVETLIALKDLSGDGGGRNDDSGTLGIIKAIAPLATPVLQGMAASAQERAATASMQAQSFQPPRLSNPAPAARRTINPQPIPPAEPVQPVAPAPGAAMTYFDGGEVPMFLLQIRPQIQQLCELAAQTPTPDPVEVAQMTLAAIPETYDDKLGELLYNEKFMVWLKQLDPRVAQHQAWFDQLHAELKKAFTEEPDQGQPSLTE